MRGACPESQFPPTRARLAQVCGQPAPGRRPGWRTAPGNTDFPAGNQLGGHGGQLRTKVTVQRLGAGGVRSLQDSHHPQPFPQAFQGHCCMPRRKLPTEPLGWFSARRGICLGLVPLEAGSGGQTDICWPIMRWWRSLPSLPLPASKVPAPGEVGFPGLAVWEIKSQERWRDSRERLYCAGADGGERLKPR